MLPEPYPECTHESTYCRRDHQCSALWTALSLSLETDQHIRGQKCRGGVDHGFDSFFLDRGDNSRGAAVGQGEALSSAGLCRLRTEPFYSAAIQGDGWDEARQLCALHESCIQRRATAPRDDDRRLRSAGIVDVRRRRYSSVVGSGGGGNMLYRGRISDAEVLRARRWHPLALRTLSTPFAEKKNRTSALTHDESPRTRARLRTSPRARTGPLFAMIPGYRVPRTSVAFSSLSVLTSPHIRTHIRATGPTRRTGEALSSYTAL